MGIKNKTAEKILKVHFCSKMKTKFSLVSTCAFKVVHTVYVEMGICFHSFLNKNTFAGINFRALIMIYIISRSNTQHMLIKILCIMLCSLE